MGGWDGIGIRVANGIGAIDIDHCIREDGSLNDVASAILTSFSDAGIYMMGVSGDLIFII